MVAGTGILTREQYLECIRREHAEEERVLMERWDRAEPYYGPCRLDERDWGRNEYEEAIDQRAYQIIGKEHRRRLAEIGSAVGTRVP